MLLLWASISGEWKFIVWSGLFFKCWDTSVIIISWVFWHMVIDSNLQISFGLSKFMIVRMSSWVYTHTSELCSSVWRSLYLNFWPIVVVSCTNNKFWFMAKFFWIIILPNFYFQFDETCLRYTVVLKSRIWVLSLFLQISGFSSDFWSFYFFMHFFENKIRICWLRNPVG